MSTWLVVLVGVLALVVSAGGGSPLTALVLRLAARSSDAGTSEATAGHAGVPDPDPDPAPDPAPEPDGGDGPTGPRSQAVLRGGTWIGILERLAVTASVLAGYPAGLAFVIAVKGLGRYPELRENPGASERFVIGTFASLIWAVAVGAAGRALIL